MALRRLQYIEGCLTLTGHFTFLSSAPRSKDFFLCLFREGALAGISSTAVSVYSSPSETSLTKSSETSSLIASSTDFFFFCFLLEDQSRASPSENPSNKILSPSSSPPNLPVSFTLILEFLSKIPPSPIPSLVVQEG
ncbi:hypothetical protein V6N13_088630 [Hibiscus sabdariffa]|uniref:Uncharacterized protein n=1 Tax=Hibiscus sabdariffa TaxID=183260 RepID=A0ABR2G0L0_9ROSI